jgi:hypothetical protein
MVSESNGYCSIFVASAYNNKRLTLKTENVEIQQSSFEGKYLRVINGDGDYYYKIVSCIINNNDSAILTLDEDLDPDRKAVFQYPPPEDKYDKVWFFQIVEIPIRYIVSQNATDIDDNEPHNFYNYDNRYRSVNFAISNKSFDKEDSPSEFFTISEKTFNAKIDIETPIYLEDATGKNRKLITGRRTPEYVERVNRETNKTDIMESFVLRLDNEIYDCEMTNISV